LFVWYRLRTYTAHTLLISHIIAIYFHSLGDHDIQTEEGKMAENLFFAIVTELSAARYPAYTVCARLDNGHWQIRGSA
jgi:hypothetical protein